MHSRDASSILIKPLTKRTQQGEPYFRRPDVQLQLENVLPLEETEIVKLLENRQRGELGFLLDETIVYLFRDAIAGQKNDLAETLYLELNLRISKLLLKFRSGFKNEADFEDLSQNTALAILEKLLSSATDSADYSQINFGDFVITIAKGQRNKNLVLIIREQDHLEIPNENDDEDGLENLSSLNELSVESRLIIQEGIGKLSQQHQTVAAMLLGGFQIESKDENELTISRHLNVSSRTVRNWLREMRLTLESYQGEAKR